MQAKPSLVNIINIDYWQGQMEYVNPYETYFGGIRTRLNLDAW